MRCAYIDVRCAHVCMSMWRVYLSISRYAACVCVVWVGVVVLVVVVGSGGVVCVCV